MDPTNRDQGDTGPRRRDLERRGVALFVSAEWLRTLATGLPILVAAFWVIRGQAWLWRRWIWQEVGGVIERTAQQLDGRILPLPNGWRVQGEARRIDWVGGIFGTQTIVDGVVHEGLSIDV